MLLVSIKFSHFILSANGSPWKFKKQVRLSILWHHEPLLSLLYSSSESRSNQKAEENLESRARQEKAAEKNSVDKALGDQNINLIASKQKLLKNNENKIERLNEELQAVNKDIQKLEICQKDRTLFRYG